MLKILIFLSVIFILSFLLLFWFINHQNKKEESKDSLLTLIVVAILFSVIITFVFAFSLFLIMGSTSIIDTIFSLNINTNQLIVIGISFLIYLMTIDNIFETLFEYLWGKNIYAVLSTALSRVGAFYIIGILIKLNDVINVTISVGVSLILLTIEVLSILKDAKS
ncbi:hypothetical protein D8M04_04320 [Oceanobacillus piezotolerans]|uniref:Uncharacterized protein n=1 Tax=Oceanobacillus piezotolerans TaxID=2448030 RepID=A0A498DH33_9BACI|nr:hypothetical protein [Oceanobacillus piezotolerans]RLL48488.1 hypothetical protein D8M04_04320 [Oceanobacillus piezotolerans]